MLQTAHVEGVQSLCSCAEHVVHGLTPIHQAGEDTDLIHINLGWYGEKFVLPYFICELA